MVMPQIQREHLCRGTPGIKPSDNIIKDWKNSVIRFSFKNAMITFRVEFKGFILARGLLIKILAH